MNDTDRLAEARVRGYLAAVDDYNLGARFTLAIPEAAGPYKLSRTDVERLLDQLEQARKTALCLACPPGCHECAGTDCECYEHQDLDPEHLKDEADRLRAAIQRVRDLHHKASHGIDCVYCTGLDRQSNYDCTWPCDTIRALDGEASDG